MLWCFPSLHGKPWFHGWKTHGGVIVNDQPLKQVLGAHPPRCRLPVVNLACYLMYSFVKLARDRKYEFCSHMVVKSKGKSWKFQGNLGWWNIIPFGQMDCIWKIQCSRLSSTQPRLILVQFQPPVHIMGLLPANVFRCKRGGGEPKDQMNHTKFEHSVERYLPN